MLLAKKGLSTGNCNQLGKRKTLETLMFRFDTSCTYYHLHTEERGEKVTHREKFTMGNRRLVPYHQRPHWFYIVGRNTLEQSCPIKTENKISCGFIHCWTKKCETWHLEEMKVFGIFGNALFWKAQKQPIWINNCLESRELSQVGKEKSPTLMPWLPAGRCCAFCIKA